ncbi:MAG: GIY-YIG nuclease family protein [Deferribacterales bacterium]
MKQGYVYILTNKTHTVLYIGVTSNLVQRIYQHREKQADGFTAKYNISKLVYYEVADDIETAIIREKQLKNKSRKTKEELVSSMNPEWIDLYKSLN